MQGEVSSAGYGCGAQAVCIRQVGSSQVRSSQVKSSQVKSGHAGSEVSDESVRDSICEGKRDEVR